MEMSIINTSENIRPETRRLVLTLLLIAAFVAYASQTMMVTALPVIKNAMHVQLTTVQWLTTGYTLVTGIVTPLSSNMYEKFRSRTIFLGILFNFYNWNANWMFSY